MKLRDLILHDYRLKLFALVVAWLLWETVHLGTKNGTENGPPGHSWIAPTNAPP